MISERFRVRINQIFKFDFSHDHKTSSTVITYMCTYKIKKVTKHPKNIHFIEVEKKFEDCWAPQSILTVFRYTWNNLIIRINSKLKSFHGTNAKKKT